ncbi:RNA-directed DNA polymerase, eukaryota, reverse transcriptase zinc-binding domain protein [Tanacetum coccineum]
MLAQELTRGYNRRNGPKRCAMQIDIQKAYYTVSWRFLEEVLIKFAFPAKMVKWIMACISSSAFFICLNEEVHGYFKGGRGLRQGDPISLYLFTLVIEELKLSHICFADDLLVLWKGNRGSLEVVKKYLEEFSLVSGLNPNLGKSTIFFGSIKDRDRSDLLEILPFKCGKLQVRYLGVPLLAKRLSVLDCKVLTDKVEERINCWRNKHLSYAGRIQLLAYVLSSIKRAMYEARIKDTMVVAEMMDGDRWNWPEDWLTKFLILSSINPLKLQQDKKDEVLCQLIPRHAFILWLAIQGKLMTQDKMEKWQNNVDLRCALCKNCVDSHDHLFFKCDYALKVWKEMLKKANNLQDKIGNGLLDDVSDTRGAVNFAWSHALVPKDTRDEFLLSCAPGSHYEDEACNKAYETLLSEIEASNGRIVCRPSSGTSDESDEGDAHEVATDPGDEQAEQQIQTADSDNEFRQTSDSDRQHYPDKQGKTRQHQMQNQTDAEPDVTNITRKPEPK